MSFTRVKPAGWAFGEKLTSDQMNTLDLDHSRAVDGNAGGNYSPSADINISGNRLHFGQSDLFLPFLIVSIGNFTYTATGGPGGNAVGQVQGSAPSSADAVRISMMVPQSANAACKMTRVRAHYRPANGHGGVPASQPSILWFRQGTGAGAAVILGTAQDNAASVGEYESARTITLTTDVVITSSDAYYLAFFGEGSTNALQGLLLTRFDYTIAPL
jgi:hypothetical protein